MMLFTHPEPVLHRERIYPAFIPFAGCPQRCLFCAQSIQTGLDASEAEDAIARMDVFFHASHNTRFDEIAFYGGTFTAMPLSRQHALLDRAAALKKQGVITRIRCSTRPDAVSAESLADLQTRGLDIVELGVQSFHDGALRASRRGYSSDIAQKACETVMQCGLTLGVQLMPGMPGSNERTFAEDIRICSELQPDFTRLYPCLVLEGTGLAGEWHSRRYEPWTLQTVLEELPPAVLALWRAGIRVIRTGLAPQDGMGEHILAGPRHPALGQMIRSRALLLYIRQLLEKDDTLQTPRTLFAPKRFQGELLGQKSELASGYSALGFHQGSFIWWDNEYFKVESV